MVEGKKQIAILGSTGSIGTQALEVIEANPQLFEVYVLTAQNNVDLLIAQGIEQISIFTGAQLPTAELTSYLKSELKI